MSCAQPASEADVERQGAAARCQSPGLRLRSRLRTWFCARQVAGNLTRDFSARERTYLSWVKISLVLGSIACVMLLKLDLNAMRPPADSESEFAAPTAASEVFSASRPLNFAPIHEKPFLAPSDPSQGVHPNDFARSIWIARHVSIRRNRSAKAAAWIRQLQQQEKLGRGNNPPAGMPSNLRSATPVPTSSTPFPRMDHQIPLMMEPPHKDKPPTLSLRHESFRNVPTGSVGPGNTHWRTQQWHPQTARKPQDFLSSNVGSIASGAVYFLQSMLSLVIGLLDYLRTERALEKIDEISQNEAEAKQALEAHTAALKRAHDQVRASSLARSQSQSQSQSQGVNQNHAYGGSRGKLRSIEEQAQLSPLQGPTSPPLVSSPGPLDGPDAPAGVGFASESALVARIPPPPATVPRLRDEDVARARSDHGIDLVTGLLILLGIIIAASAVMLMIDEAPIVA